MSTYLTTTTGARDAIVAQAKALAAEVQGGKLDKTAASYYVKVMEKLEGSNDWAGKELARLQKMASKKGALAGKQLEDLQVSLNWHIRVPCFMSTIPDTVRRHSRRSAKTSYKPSQSLKNQHPQLHRSSAHP